MHALLRHVHGVAVGVRTASVKVGDCGGVSSDLKPPSSHDVVSDHFQASCCAFKGAQRADGLAMAVGVTPTFARSSSQ